MKSLYIDEIRNYTDIGNRVEISCWIKHKRIYNSIIFYEIEDSTGTMSAILEKNAVDTIAFNSLKKIPNESSVLITGILRKNPNNNKEKEINIEHFEIINKVTKQVNPSPRSINNPFDKKYSNQILNCRHLYIRNSKITSVIKVKHKMLIALREWLNNNKFTEVDTPILTQSNLYDNNNTFSTDYFGTKVYLSQCAGLYLGAIVPSLEKVYTVTPAFRKESSKSPRHNPEFYHLKGQMAFYNIEDTIKLVEDLIYYTVTSIAKNCIEELLTLGVNIDLELYKPPYPQISYTDSIKILKSHSIDIKMGQSLNEKAEQCIADKYNKPTFVMNIPKEIEPFPYKLTKDKSFTKTTDLLIPDGFGEILGIAEFIFKNEELKERMIHKKKMQKKTTLSGIQICLNLVMSQEVASEWV